MGRPDMAAHFRAEYDIPFMLLVDHEKQTYRALELPRGGWMDVTGPKVWGRAFKAATEGHLSTIPKQDPRQLGGVAIVDTSGEVVYLHRAESSSDNPPVDVVLEALP